MPLDPDVAGADPDLPAGRTPARPTATALFVVAKGPHRGRPLTPAGLRTVFRYHRDRAGVPAGHPHALRHTFGTALAEAGVDLAVLQALMGHDHVDSAAAYIHLAPTHLRAAFDAARARQRAREPEAELLAALRARTAAGRAARGATSQGGPRRSWPAGPTRGAGPPSRWDPAGGYRTMPVVPEFLMLGRAPAPGLRLPARAHAALWRELPATRWRRPGPLPGRRRRARLHPPAAPAAARRCRPAADPDRGPLDALTDADLDALSSRADRQRRDRAPGCATTSGACMPRGVLYHLGILPPRR